MESRSNSKKMIPIVIVGILLIIAALGAFVFYHFVSGSHGSSISIKLKYEDKMYFDLFRTSFDEKILKESPKDYVFSKTQEGFSEEEKKIFDKHPAEMKLLVDMINYTLILHSSGRALGRAKDNKLKGFDTNTVFKMDKETAKKWFDEVLADAGVFGVLVKSITDIHNLQEVDLTNFLFSSVFPGMPLFHSASEINMDGTGITSLEGLENLTASISIYANNNNITEIPPLNNSPGIRNMYLEGNNIVKIAPNFLKDHQQAIIHLAPKKGGELSKEVIEAGRKNPTKIIILQAQQ